MAENKEYNELDDLNVQNTPNETESNETNYGTRSFSKGLTKGENDNTDPSVDGENQDVPTRDGGSASTNTTNYLGPIAEMEDKLGHVHPIHAKQLEYARELELQGDVTGTKGVTFAEKEVLTTSIPSNTITAQMMKQNSVYGSAGHTAGDGTRTNIVAGTITKTELNSAVYTDEVTPNNQALVTSGAVATAIETAVSGRGINYGPKTVAYVNAITDSIPNGSTVHITGTGEGSSYSITDGISFNAQGEGTHGAITVTAGADLQYYNSSSLKGWYSLDGEFKKIQTPVHDPTASGSTITAIDMISQDANGNITATKKTIQDGTTQQKGIVQLEDSHTSTSTTKAATPKSVKEAYDLANGKLSPVTAVTDPVADGNGITFVDSVTQDTTAQITVHRKTVTPADASHDGLMSSADYSKLAALPTNTQLENNYKKKQTAITTDPTADGTGLTFVDSVKQNAQGVVEVHRKTVKEAASASSSASATSGIMSAVDKAKLDGISSGANKVEASTNGNIKIDDQETNVYTHPNVGTAGSFGDQTDRTPGFGGTFNTVRVTVDANGHVSGHETHSVTIPSATATTSENGLMSSADKSKLNGIASGAEVNQDAYSTIKVGTETRTATSKTDTFEFKAGNGVTLTLGANGAKEMTISSSTDGSAGTATPQDVTSGTAAVGTSMKFAREDHKHHIAVATGSTGGTINVAGSEVAVKDWGAKADKVSNATAGNFAGLDVNGNLTDSGSKASDFKTKQDAVSDPTASGTGLAFIATASQDTNGNMTVSKKTVQDGTTTQKGVVQLQDSVGASETVTTKAVTPHAVRAAINELNVTAVGGNDNQYVKAISESAGKISATVETADDTPTEDSTKLVTSGAVAAALKSTVEGLDVTDTAETNKFVTAVSETDGKISVTRAQPTIENISGLTSALAEKQPNLTFDGTYNASSNKAATVSSVTSRIGELNATVNSAGATGVSPNFGLQIVETAGKITSLKVTSDGTEKTANKAQSISTSDTDANKYPSNAAVAAFVNSSIATNTANFLGTYDVVTDLHGTTEDTNATIASNLATYHPWTERDKTATNNDYVFVSINRSSTTTVDEYRRFKFDGTNWAYEYTLNNSSFTQAQWDAINSAITAADKAAYDAHIANKSNPHEVTKAQVGLGIVSNETIVVTSSSVSSTNASGTTTTFNKYVHPTTTAVTADAVKVGKDSTGHVVIGDHLAKGDVGLDQVDNTSDATKKTSFTGSIASGNTGFATGGAVYTELGKKQNTLASQTAYTSKGSATKVPQITTNNLGQVTGITEVTISGVAPAAHTHGNIQNGGTLQTNDVTIASGDKLVITDATDSNKVARASVSFDGTTTNKALTPKGTFETFLQTHQSLSHLSTKAETVTNVAVSGTEITKTINGSPTNVANLDGTYNATNNKIATQDTVKNAINNLDATINDSKTNVSVEITQTDGKLTGVTVTDNTASSNHVHGDINNNGTISANAVTVASGDSLVVTDSSASGKVVKSNISFNGDATKALTAAGTWATFNNQNSFSKIAVSGQSTVEADATADTVTLVNGSGITITTNATADSVTIGHTNSVTASTIGQSAASSGNNIAIPYATYDANGHITGKGTHTHTIPTASTANDGKGVTTLKGVIDANESDDTKAATPKAVRDAINNLDVDAVGGDGKYIKSISEANGKISPVVETMDTTPTRDSLKAVTSGGIQEALDKKLDVDDIESLAMSATYDETHHRLTFNDIIFNSIYPVVGKYGLAVFKTDTTTAAIESSGDKEWLLDWRPYLVDMNAVSGETAKKPIAELRKANWLKTVDGSYAPVCGITTAQSTALDNKTVLWKPSGENITTKIPNAFSNGKFQADKVWEYIKANMATVRTLSGVNYGCAIEVKLYVGSQAYSYGAYDSYHIPAPWETTRTDLSVFIGRPTDVYVIDGAEKYGDYMRGLCAKPVPVGTSQFDPEFFKLKRTGISPGPSTVVGNKIRNFFYNYKQASNPTDGGSVMGSGMLSNNGTYPVTNGANQYRTARWARGCNSGGSSGSAVPVAEGGFHALNAFLCSIEAAYKTRNVFGSATTFSTGNSSNDACTNAETYRTNGGFRLDIDANTSYYYKFNENLKNTTARPSGITSDQYVYNVVNDQHAHFQCMEPQIAASLFTEMGLDDTNSFNWNGGEWHYEKPTFTGITLNSLDGSTKCMNCRIYKDVAFSNRTIGNLSNCKGSFNLRCSLAEGVNAVGDIWWYQGGGCELVYKNNTSETALSYTDYTYSFYLEPDQASWLTGAYVAGASNWDEYHADGHSFDAETHYTAIITDSTAGGTGTGYALARTGYTPVKNAAGGSNTTGECGYQYRSIEDQGDHPVSGASSRRFVVFRGRAAIDSCSPRYLAADNRPSRTNVLLGCAAQVLLA